MKYGNDVLAAGAVLWHAKGRVAVVHRPRYDDWTLPKGKLDDGETLAATAVREVAEETGFDSVLGARLGTVRYPLSTGQTKVVEYFAARAGGGRFEVDKEVDELRWCTPEQAHELLSYVHDKEILDTFTALPPVAATVLLVRHAKAGSRADWAGHDDQRPLSGAGRKQAAALAELLPLWDPQQVHAAPRVRCVDTVSAVAEDLEVPVEEEPLLSEEGYWPDPAAGMKRFLDIAEDSAAEGAPVVVCSQGGVIPDLVARLAAAARIDVGEVASKKGSLWVLSLQRTSPELTLAAADYYPSPLPLAKAE